jgi:hypothetical protein
METAEKTKNKNKKENKDPSQSKQWLMAAIASLVVGKPRFLKSFSKSDA